MPETRSAQSGSHIELYLSGDFQDPLAVIAADGLSKGEKAEILDFWERELDAMSSGDDRDALRDAISKARGMLHES